MAFPSGKGYFFDESAIFPGDKPQISNTGVD